jgi:hypothetical protein
VLTAQNCSITVCRFLVACVRTTPEWRESRARTEKLLLEMCLQWLSTFTPENQLTPAEKGGALRAVILSLFTTTELTHAISRYPGLAQSIHLPLGDLVPLVYFLDPKQVADCVGSVTKSRKRAAITLGSVAYHRFFRYNVFVQFASTLARSTDLIKRAVPRK